MKSEPPCSLLVILKSAAGTLSAGEMATWRKTEAVCIITADSQVLLTSCNDKAVIFSITATISLQQLFIGCLGKAFFHVRAGKR